jgi:hypothetical protein
MSTKKSKDNMVEALHAAAIAQHGGAKDGSPWWVFTSETTDGAWLFTYKPSMSCPGAGWKPVPQRRIESVQTRGEGEEGYVRVGP